MNCTNAWLYIENNSFCWNSNHITDTQGVGVANFTELAFIMICGMKMEQFAL